MQPRTKITGGAAVVAALGLLLYVSASRRSETTDVADAASAPSTVASQSAAAVTIDPLDAEPEPLAPSAAETEDGASASPRTMFVARWGSARGELGRERPEEGNPEGPMSLVLAGKDLLVLDQVNGRLARYDANGRLLSTTDAPKTAQDVAVGKDGTVAMIDRLVGKAVTLVDANGHKIGDLPLGPNAGEPGLVTAVVVDGKNVYVEREHGALVLLGGTDGSLATDEERLTGRPSKDGTLLLTAGLSSKAQGRAFLNAVDRKTASLKFARTILFQRPAQAIVLLDTDAKGTIYLGVASGEPGDAHIACLDPGDGHVLGRVVLPLSHTPEESFRDFTVGSDGSIAFAVRTEHDVRYLTATCP